MRTAFVERSLREDGRVLEQAIGDLVGRLIRDRGRPKEIFERLSLYRR